MAYLVRDARSRSPYWYGVYLVVSPGGQRLWVGEWGITGIAVLQLSGGPIWRQQRRHSLL